MHATTLRALAGVCFLALMIALVGDYSSEVPAHRAIPLALERACSATAVTIDWQWVGTESIKDAPRDLAHCMAVWCVPASPYRSMDGALAAIRFARETGRAFLGTCGGFQHAVIEFARNVAGIADAEYTESSPRAAEPVITPLACPLVESEGDISFTVGSRLHQIFNGLPTRGEYRCSYGVNPHYRAALEVMDLRFTGFDPEGGIRALELPGHPFFVATLFQPERSALRGKGHPLIEAFVRAAAHDIQPR